MAYIITEEAVKKQAQREEVKNYIKLYYRQADVIISSILAHLNNDAIQKHLLMRMFPGGQLIDTRLCLLRRIVQVESSTVEGSELTNVGPDVSFQH